MCFLHTCLLVCSVAAGGHHDWVWPLLCLLEVAQVLFYRHVCWFVLWLQVATMTGFGPFCVLSIRSHPGSFRQTCLLVCSVSAGGHHSWVWASLCLIDQTSPRFVSTDVFVDLFCGCGWPPWLGLAPSVFYQSEVTQVSLHRHVCWFVLWLLVATMTGFGPFCVYQLEVTEVLFYRHVCRFAL